MNIYTIEVMTTGGARNIEEVRANSKLAAHKIVSEKYKGLYAASTILDEKMVWEDFECPVCHNKEQPAGGSVLYDLRSANQKGGFEMKYKIQVGAFITHIANGTFIVSAKSEDEAIEKAKDRFTKRQLSSPRNNDVGDIMVDSIEIIEEGRK